MTGLRVVHDLDNPNATSAIFVHGLAGKQNDTWAKLSESSWGYAEWFEFQDAQTLFYNYPLIDETAIALTREGLRREAIQLLEGILTLRRARGSKLVFVAHDIGGTLIKEALIQSALGNPKFRDIFWSTSALVFIGCPHSSRPSAALQRSLLPLLKVDQSIQSQRVKVIAAGLMSAIYQVNLDFADIDVQLFAFTYNVISRNTSDGSRIFDQSETVMTFSSVLEGRQEISHLSHREMARTISAEAQNALMSIVLDSDRQRPSLRIMLLSSKRQNTVYDEFHAQGAEMVAFRIMQDPKFQKWNSASGPCRLAVQNVIDATGTGAVLQRDCISNTPSLSNPETRLVQFFEFRNTDCRYNTVRAMLSTFLAEIYHRNVKARDAFSQLPLVMDIEEQFDVFQDIISDPESPETV